MSKNETTEESVTRARLEAESKLALYGSIDRWPTLSLEQRIYAKCECGHRRAEDHKLIGTDRGPCTKCTCNCFVFAKPATDRRAA
jgi:hypothetical protein